jgi:hypothetical protein
MAPSYLRKAYPHLEVLLYSKNDRKLRCLLLKNQLVIKALSELALNLLKENVQLSEIEKKRLRKYAKELLKLARKSGCAQKTKLLAGQRGEGVLSTLLTIGLPILSQLLFSKKNAKD